MKFLDGAAVAVSAGHRVEVSCHFVDDPWEQTAFVAFVYLSEDRMANYPTVNRPLSTADDYRQRAEECLKLASAAKEPHVRAALLELVAEFSSMAETLKRQAATGKR